MTWKLPVAALVVMFCVVGCSQSQWSRVNRSAPTKDPLVMTRERLESENLPALDSVSVWENPYGPGLKLTTAHYEIFTTLLEPLVLRTVPGFFTRTFAGAQAPVFCKIKTGAYYLNGACVVYDIGRKRTLSAIGHEGWHQFNSRHFRYRLPSWLDEGIAMLFEASTYENGMFAFDPARNYQRLGALSETLGSTELIPLKELIATSPGEVLATDQAEAVMAFYSQSYALVRFLREARHGERLTRYHRLLWDGLLGEWPLDRSDGQTAENRNLPRTIHWNRVVGSRLFEHYVGDDFGQLQREYLAYCHQMVHGMSFVRADDYRPAGVYR